MGAWLWWALSYICPAIAVLKVAGGVCCIVELRRKWRATPEFWGLDWLEVVYCVEREFGVTLTAADFVAWSADARVGLTAGQLWELIANKLRVADAAVPADGWERVVSALSEALYVRANRISAESRLYADLGMVYGLE